MNIISFLSNSFYKIQTVGSYEYAHKNPKYLSLTNVFVALYLKFITA